MITKSGGALDHKAANQQMMLPMNIAFFASREDANTTQEPLVSITVLIKDISSYNDLSCDPAWLILNKNLTLPKSIYQETETQVL